MNVYDYHGFDKDYKEFFEKFTNTKDYSIIELGCGNGSLCYNLEQSGFNVTGTDIQKKKHGRHVNMRYNQNLRV